MYAWKPPNVGRAEADVRRWRELLEKIRTVGWWNLTEAEQEAWLAGISNGSYNAADLNRVEGNTGWLRDTLAAAGYHIPLERSWFYGHEIKTTWGRPSPNIYYQSIPDAAEMTRYLGNVRALAEGYYVLATTPPLPESMDNLDWRVANAIEQNQADMHANIGRMVAGYRKLGTFRLGQGGNLPT